MHLFDLDSPVLDADLDRVERRLERTTLELDPIGEMARHHWSGVRRHAPARTALAAARTCGVAAEVAVGIATACELLNEAVVVHEEARVGVPLQTGGRSVGRHFGRSSAAQFGDYLFMLAIDEIGRLEGASPPFIRLFTTTALQVIRGMELDFESAGAGDTHAERTAEWVAHVRRKEGALLALPLEAVMRRAGASDTDQIRARAAMEWVAVAAREGDCSDVLSADGDAVAEYVERARQVASELPAELVALIESVLAEVVPAVGWDVEEAPGSVPTIAHGGAGRSRWAGAAGGPTPTRWLDVG